MEEDKSFEMYENLLLTTKLQLLTEINELKNKVDSQFSIKLKNNGKEAEIYGLRITNENVIDILSWVTSPDDTVETIGFTKGNI